MDNKNVNLPNKAFDSEYMTEWGREVKFLASKGIRYTFVRTTPDYHIRQYKYKKTPELFLALYEFYAFMRNEKEFNQLTAAMKEAGETTVTLDEMPKGLLPNG